MTTLNRSDETPALEARLEEALRRGSEHLLSLQHADGYWWAELESNVTMASEHVLLEEFLDVHDASRRERTCRYILQRQSPDGGWPIYFGGPSDVSITSEAYFALKLSGIDPESAPMARAREFVREHGGVGRARIFTKLWFALFGQFDWKGLPAMPPEAILLPANGPFSIYDFASWARATMVPILVLWERQPVHRPQSGLGAGELFLSERDQHQIDFKRDDEALTWRNTFLLTDRLLKSLEASRLHPLRAKAIAACERWILAHQEMDGAWGGIQPPTVYSMLALHCLGYSNNHPVMRNAFKALFGEFALEDDETWTMQPCVSPIWDTALAITGLREAGVPADDERLLRAGRWLLSKETRSRGDWSLRLPRIEPGGWAFEFANEAYPDIDDTAEVLIALRLLTLRAEAEPAVRRALAWLDAMQCSNGGWAAFDRDNDRQAVTAIPFADFGATLDPPTEDVTAHVIEAWLLHGTPPSDPFCLNAQRFLLQRQAPSGAWWGRWGVNYIYGLGAVVPALAAAGLPADAPAMLSAVHWLEEHQNEDGGWGETCASYEDPDLQGYGPSTASQTAWALLALLALRPPDDPCVRRGIEYLVETQKANGEWEESAFTGTGFPVDFMLKYHYYRLYWPLWALGRYSRLQRGQAIHVPGSEPYA